MLSSLTIQNFGLIDQVELEFSLHLNILTGSTGAGKSIIIDALRYALGERLQSAQIREADQPCLVEVVFELNDQKLRGHDAIRDFLADGDTCLIINRQSFADGRNKIKVNGFNVTAGQLKSLGNLLVDFHGAHDHQMLFAEEFHLGVLDQLTDFGPAREQYGKIYSEYADLKSQARELLNLSSSRERELELLSHQVQELQQLPLDESKYEELAQDEVKLKNAQKLYEYLTAILGALDGGETSVAENIRRAFSPMARLNQIDEKTLPLNELLGQIQENNNQLAAQLQDYLNSLSFQSDDADEINRKLEAYKDIKRKYGPSLAQAQAFFDAARKKHDLLVNLEENNTELQEKIVAVETQLKKAAQKLTTFRRKSAAFLKETIEKELKDLGIAHVTFEARINPAEFNKHGQDEVVFYISPNAGESLKPLAQIVSSGEAARVMLALKKALIKVDPIPVLIFDEIDAQIGGRLGTITGTKLKELSRHRQVILITHLPQIASFGATHFKVTKDVKAGRTTTAVRRLDEKERVAELSQMMSGEGKSRISLEHAQELLAQAQK